MVDITFDSMDDFSPAAVARKVDALRKLLEARQQLANLLTYMDGKTRRRAADPAGAPGPDAAPGTGRRPQARRGRGGRASRSPNPLDEDTLWRHSNRPRVQGGALEVSELDQLLQKEFKPRSDAAKEAVESAVRTLAAAGAQRRPR